MLDNCSTKCPKCQHRFQCCRPLPTAEADGSSTASITATTPQSTSLAPTGALTSSVITSSTSRPAAQCSARSQQQRLLTGGGLITPLRMPSTAATATDASASAPSIPPAIPVVGLFAAPVIGAPRHHLVSPSIQLAFFVPNGVSPAHPATAYWPDPSTYQQQPQPHVVENEVSTTYVDEWTIARRLESTVRALRLSGWYHEKMSYGRSDELLKECAEGTFLVRDSSDPHFQFTLSVQTDWGPTSARLHYEHGRFRIDAQPHLRHSMPSFPCVVELVEHYVRECASGKCLYKWVDLEGRCVSDIMLRRPLYRAPHTVPALKHLARIAVHRAKRNESMAHAHQRNIQELPGSVREYLFEYAHTV